EISLEIDPTQVDAWVNKGFALGETRKYEQALDAYNHALALTAPPIAYGIIWYNKGNVLVKVGRSTEALEAYEHALAFPIDPTNTVYTLHNMGNILSDEWQLEEAILCYNEAIQIAPRYAQLWIGKARAL